VYVASKNNNPTLMTTPTNKLIQSLSIIGIAFVLTACGGGGGGSQPATNSDSSSVNTPSMTDAQAKDIALKLWRNDDLKQHPKGSCAGCHGADFFDLARIGSSEEDMLRRAKIDGASDLQAQALVQTVKKIRGDMNLPTASARSFRPLQPGGSVLLPDLTDGAHIVAVKRDIAFAEQLKTLLPTLMVGRIDSLAKAQKARDELLDLAQGTNKMDSNPKLLNLRSLPNGIVYPLWSADLHHGKSEGTFNDWTADIAHDPKPERKAEWLALQDTYLATPSNENFWRMYFSARDMTQVPLLGTCAVGGASCDITDDFNKHKFLSAMLGQHLMRLQNTGKIDTFARGAIAFSYLDSDPTYAFSKNRPNIQYLPSSLWEVGDNGRVLLGSAAGANNTGSFKKNLASLGYPEFAQDSIDGDRTALTEATALRLPWFWIGFTYDPSMARISGSNSTRVGEYMVGTLIQERYFNHHALSTLIRLVTKGSLPEANVEAVGRSTDLKQLKPKYIMEYGYALGYGRASLTPNKWNEDKVITIPQDLKDKSAALFAAITGNGFRMSMYLQAEQLDKTGADAFTSKQLDFVKDLFTDQNQAKGAFCPIHNHFKDHHASSLNDDAALMEMLWKKLDLATRSWPCY
jgi:hypothetical protein